MTALIATLVTILVSAMVMRYDRDKVRISKAIWIPFLWLSIASSRPVSNWVSFGAPTDVSDQYIEGSPIDRNVLTALLVVAVVVLSGRSRQVKAIVRANTPIVIFLAYCGISMFWADYPVVVFKRWIREVADVAMVCVILTEAFAADAVKRVLMWVGWILVPLSILYTRFFPSLGRAYSVNGTPLWTGVARDKNALGALCMIVGVMLVSRALAVYSTRPGKERRRMLLVTGALFAMVLHLLIMVDSKTALACFVMASTLIALRRFVPAFRKPWCMTCAVAVMLFINYAVLFLGIGSSALSELGRDTSLTGRTQVWGIVLSHVVNPWIGAGYENFWIGDRLQVVGREIMGLAEGEALGGGLNQAHNGYIEIYLNIGWIGLGLLGFVILSGYRNIIRSSRTDGEMGGLKLAFFLICLVYNFTEAAFKILSPVWITFLWAIIATPKSLVPTRESGIAPQFARRLAWAEGPAISDSPWYSPTAGANRTTGSSFTGASSRGRGQFEGES